MRVREISNAELKADEYKKNPFAVGAKQDADRLRLGEAAEPAKKARNPLFNAAAPAPKIETVPTRKTPDLSDDWIRQDVTSRTVPYPEGTEIFIRDTGWHSLSHLYAARESESFTLLVDALSRCIHGLDTRDLTPPDFFFLMYWIRDNSFPTSPLRIEWISRYGNTNHLSIQKRDLVLTELEMTREEAAEWREKGITFPTVRDMEMLSDDDLPTTDRWMLQYAQYAAIENPAASSDYTGDKIAALHALSKQHGLEKSIALIDEFAGKITHGVRESFTIRDPQFEPLAAAQHFENLGKRIMSTLEEMPEEDTRGKEDVFLGLLSRANAYLAEAAGIRAAVEAGETVVAEEEVVALSITATDFFPSL